MQIPDAIAAAVGLTLTCVLAAPRVFAGVPQILSIEPETESVGIYEKLELRVDLDCDLTNPCGQGASPFDPQKRLTSTLTFDTIRGVGASG